MNLTLEEISNAVGGALEGPRNTKVTGYSIDTRTLHAGEIFFAVKGPRLDGHQFLDQAFQNNASAVVVEEAGLKPAPGGAQPMIHVRSTVAALQTLARHVRRQWRNPIIGVTGSAGKTTTKDAIAHLLEAGGAVVGKTVGNLNNHVGVPLSILRLPDRARNGTRG